MFKDIRLLVDDKKINYEVLTTDKKITINVNDLEKDKILKIYYDENIYDIKFKSSTSFSYGLPGEIFVNISKKTLSFSIILKSNFFFFFVYKYINRLIDKKMLVNEIELFNDSISKKKINNDLDNLLISIDNNDKDLGELIVEMEDEFHRIFKLLVNNETYLSLALNMSIHELMLLITSFISVPSVPNVDQETFNELVMDAVKSDYALENVWRLAMNYDGKGYNYDLIDYFFVHSKDVGYLGEYITGVIQVNQENVFHKVIETKDTGYIKKILDYDMLMNRIEKKYKTYLKTNYKKLLK